MASASPPDVRFFPRPLRISRLSFANIAKLFSLQSNPDEGLLELQALSPVHSIEKTWKTHIQIFA